MTDNKPLIPRFPPSSHRLSVPRLRNTVWPIHDLFFNEILLWILPTHRRTLVFKFVTVIGLVVHLSWKLCGTSIVIGQHQTAWRASVIGATVMFLFYWCYYYRRVLTELVFRSCWWMDPGITEHLRLPMHVPMRHYITEEQARRGACCIVNTEESRGPNVWCLDSMPWKFKLQDTVQKGLAVAKNGQDVVEWQDMKVPANWTMVDNVPDGPIYTNQKYPFPCQPPLVPNQNPTGIYRLTEFDLPQHWQKDSMTSSFTIMLHGIESAAYVYCNGAMVGFTKDSRLPAEFDVTHQLRVHKNTIDIVVIRWSDGSYVEDQDHWWMAGIHRSVELIRRPPGASLIDFQVQADANGCIAVQTWTQAANKVVARLYDDDQLTPDGDRWTKGACVWEASAKSTSDQASLGTFGAVLSGNVKNPKLWNAEEPRLYTLTITVLSDSDNVTQVESCRVGFRTVDILDGMVHVNGVPITVCGINRHEHDPDHGKVVSHELMKTDICTMKQNNFNLVRTSHYPAHASFYLLCDYYGLYVWDEANIETHGMKPMGRLAQDWGWEAAFVSRITRTVQRDRNHASVIFWSMGNEAGRGRNLWKARNLVKSLDLSRPVVYEGGGSLPDGTGWTELTDVVCCMYPDVNRTKWLASRANDNRPVILCEYSHAMGNSNGNLHLYWDAIWDKNFPRLQGGAIWDFVDQGLRLPDPRYKDRCYFGYGGDFGDEINDAQFCINGMFTPDRLPHPCVHEIKFLQQPVSIKPMNLNGNGELLLDLSFSRSVSLALAVENRYNFRQLDHIEWTWVLSTNRSSDSVSAGRFVLETNQSGTSELVIDSGAVSRVKSIIRASAHDNIKFWINFKGLLKDKCDWAPAGHQLVDIQYPIKFAHACKENPRPRTCTKTPTPTFGTVGNTIIIYCEDQSGHSLPIASLDKTSGGLKSYSPYGRNLLESEMIPSFCRAFTDNDRGGMELTLDMMFPDWCYHIYWLVRGTKDFSYVSHWKMHGLDPLCPPKISCVHAEPVLNIAPGRSAIEILCDVTSTKRKSRLFSVKLRYDFYGDGRIKISQDITPSRSVLDVPSLPRIGMRVVLDESLHHIQYEGRGPGENYPDRKAGSHFGLYNTTPAAMPYLDYIVPSENGNRSDCSFIAFRDKSGEGLCLVNSDRDDFPSMFNCSAQLHSIEELQFSTHTSDLEPREDGKHPIHVNIDGELMGVGGDNSWFPVVYPEFLLPPKTEYSFCTWLLPIRAGEEAFDVAAANFS